MTEAKGTMMKDNQVQDLSKHWIRVAADDTKRIGELEAQYGLDFKTAGNKVWESDAWIYLPLLVERRDGDTISTQTLVCALSDDLLVTVQPSVPYDLFDKAHIRISRLPSLGKGPQAILCSLLWALKESCEQSVTFISDVLDNMADTIQEATVGLKEEGGKKRRELSDAELKNVVLALNECEKVVSGANDAELSLNRATRHLQGEVMNNPELDTQVGLLVGDIQIALDRAGYEQKKVRFLQELILTTLNHKQTGIIKVFTIITAVFLPPTLMSTFYGMNFTHMPELMTEHGFLICVILTFCSAMLPIWYIKRAGWMR